MRIEKIYISQYRQLSDVNIAFDNTVGEGFLQDVYGNLGISLFAGPNGSGKTALLSFIAQIFHRIEREPELLPPAFSLGYSFEDKCGQTLKCSISKEAPFDGVRLVVDGFVNGILRKNFRGEPIEDSGDLDYDDVSHYLPGNIIISAFSLHGEYPSPRSHNWIGDRRLDIYDTKNLYGNNHFLFPSFSSSISKLLQLTRSNNPAIETLESLIGGRFTGKVRTADRVWGGDSNWVYFSDEILEREKGEEIYINDFELETSIGSLTLGNMSSGQKMLFVRLLSILGTIHDNSFVIIEEPEIHLDNNWSKQLISLLLAFFNTYKAHLLIATHSFSLLNSVPKKWIFFANQGHFANPSHTVFLANEAWITNTLFSPKPHAVEEQVLRYATQATASQLETIFNELGESSAKYAVFQQLLKKKK
ncbi:AAA family ATPase [Caballeronia sp. DA-9]|uniref:AAA family ATPase n=1 Tax=Caballeronia sp. DA-9 TaxID=3436237 RepID=UPI003F67B913